MRIGSRGVAPGWYPAPAKLWARPLRGESWWCSASSLDNPAAPWELRIGDFRVFYEIENDTTVKIVSIGHKEHNDLFIRGKRVEL
jgi:hypothetical protein